MYLVIVCYISLSASVDLGDNISIAIGSTQAQEGVTSQSFRNPFDISRTGLLGQLARMRTNFLHTTHTTPNLIEESMYDCTFVQSYV